MTATTVRPRGPRGPRGAAGLHPGEDRRHVWATGPGVAGDFRNRAVVRGWAGEIAADLHRIADDA